VAAGELVGVIGLTGSGKSTLLRCLAGIVPHLVPATVTGRIRVAGLDPRVESVGSMAGRVGLVLDDPDSQVSQPTVAEEVALGLESLAVPWSEMVSRVEAALEAVGLAGMGERSPATLSGGEQQRLAIACAMAMRPSVLAMDEPTANLDSGGSTAVYELARELSLDEGCAVLLADHDVERLAACADRVVVLDGGRVVADGPAGVVLARADELAGRGLRVPQVTELAALLAGSGTGASAMPLPVTSDGAIDWLAGQVPGIVPGR
jgi:energy-coupling factor transporter ATP-binding protein EcfA2